MDVAKVEESIFVAGDAKLHGGMCRMLSAIVCKVLGIFPVLEASRPSSKLGIQALCSLHVALEKAKNLLQHCSDCSKLYLAITGESVLLKFEKARCSLMDSLRRVDDIVPQAIGCQILEIVYELEGTVFSLDSSEKQVGDGVIVLLQQDRNFSSNCYENSELETFHQASLRLGITSSRAALQERRALKKLIERARVEENKRKESIVSYLLHLMRKYSKLFRNEFLEDNDSQGSSPRSPTVQASSEECNGTGGNDQAFDPQLSKLNSFHFRPTVRRSVQMPVPPVELRCPISLQLMYDPVIISSGQTYERVCIDKWFSNGHNTCPKTQQQLNHVCLIPNYCVKGLVSSWCEQNGVPIPDSPPDCLDTSYWGLALPESESIGSIYAYKGVEVVPLELEELEGNGMGVVPAQEARAGDIFERYKSLLSILCEEDLDRQCEVVKQIRLFLKVDEEARMFMGANGFVEALVKFLILAIFENNVEAQEIGTMALFNLAVNNNRNNMMMLSAGIVPVLEEMVLNSNCYESATALYLNLSCLDEAIPIIGSSQAVPFLIKVLQADGESQCKLDALDTLYNISADSSNAHNLLSAGIVEVLQVLLTSPGECTWIEKSIAVIINLASSKFGKQEVISSPALITGLATILDTGEIIEQEQAVSCLWLLCHGNEKCCDMVLREGVIPALVSISLTGTTRGKDKAHRLLILFREQRQRDPSPEYVQQQQQQHDPSPEYVHQQQQEQRESTAEAVTAPEPKPQCKSASKKMGRAFSSIWRSKELPVYQC